jgi:ABC-type antimicrobial peptide transport system permease subunit
VGGLGISFLVRRARSSWLLLACVGVTVLLATGLAAVLWTFAAGVIPSGALSTLADPRGRVIGISGEADAGDAAADSPLIRAALRKAWPGVGFQMESALWGANPIQLQSSETSSSGTTRTSSGTFTNSGSSSLNSVQIQPASLAGISSEATLIAGEWPGPPHHGGPVPVALPEAVASRLHLTVGSVLKGTTPESGPGTTAMRVTGVFRATDPASTYWALDLLPISGISAQSNSVFAGGSSGSFSTVTYGPAVVNPAAFGGTLAVGQASWMVLPQASAMANWNIGALSASTSALISQLNLFPPRGLQVSSGLPQLLAGMASTIVLARSLFTIGALELLLVAGAGLVLAARLLASLREEESALLRARGATRWQVVRPVLAEALVLGAAVGLAGVLAGTRLTGTLAGLINVRLAGNSGITELAWLSALAMLVLCVAVMAWPALRAMTPNAARRRRGRQARLAGIAWAGGDLAVVALAAVAVWELHGYSAVAHPASGSLGIDPVVAVAPALALAGVAIIPLRGLPLLARLADKATDHERRLAAAMVSWQIARRSIRQAGPVLLVVVATATTTLAVAGYASWRQSASDQAAFAVGSDVRVDSGGELPLSAASAITHAPGVTAATAASLAPITNTSSPTSASEAQLIALDASTAGKTILLRPDLSPLPLSALWQRITPQPSGLALPGQPDRLELLATLGAAKNTSAAEARTLGSAMVTASIEDGTGTTYQIPAAEGLPFDGRPHSLVFMLTGPRPHQASYPFRLLGLELTYSLPLYNPAKAAPTAALSVESLAVAATASGPFGRPFLPGAALASWTSTASSPAVPTGPPDAEGGMPPSGGEPPAVLGWHRAAGGAQRLTFYVGHDPTLAIMLSEQITPGQIPGQVSITAQPPNTLVPAIATSGYLAANRLHIGSTVSIPLTLNQYQVTFQIVASVTRFPTVFGQNEALIADLTEINDVLIANQQTPLPVTQWWLSTVGGSVPRLPAGLGLSVTSRASQEAVLLSNPLLKAPRQAMLAIGVAALLLAVLGFSISVAASLRSRRTQSAVFAALGVGKNAQAGQLCLEQCALSVPAAAAGLLAGIGLAQLLVPAITLTGDAAEPIPSALAIVPLGPALALAFVIAAVPAAAAALSILRRPDPAAQLRVEAG